MGQGKVEPEKVVGFEGFSELSEVFKYCVNICLNGRRDMFTSLLFATSGQERDQQSPGFRCPVYDLQKVVHVAGNTT